MRCLVGQAARRGVGPSRSLCRSYVSIQDMVLGTEPLDDVLRDLSKHPYPKCQLVKGRYLSPWSQQTEKSASAVLTWLATRQQNKLTFPSSLKVSRDPVALLAPKRQVDRVKMADKSKAHVTWIGHATVHAQIGGLNFLTDPMFSDYAAPVQIMGPRRFVRPAVQIEDLDIDVVLLSHTHYDHLDYNSAMRIANKPKPPLWLVPLGVKAILEGWGIEAERVVEMDWWESRRLGQLGLVGAGAGAGAGQGAEDVEVHFVPAKHWTARTPFDRNTCLWGGFAVLSPRCRFYFSGDTAYEETVFKQIGAKLGPFDLSALPIGAYKPRYFMRDHHCDPAEALDIHADVRSRQSVAIHWGTFPLADEDVAEPALELARAREAKPDKLRGGRFFTLAHGATHVVGDEPEADFAQRQPLLLEHYAKHWRGREA